MRGLESGGDHLAVRGNVRLHVEVKRQERGFRWAWATQAVADAPEGSCVLVVYRRNHSAWSVALRDWDWSLAQQIAFLADSIDVREHPLTFEEWTFLPLGEFLRAVA